jgi:hypothetical protein
LGGGGRVGKSFTYTPFGWRIFCGLRVPEWMISMGHRFWCLTLKKFCDGTSGSMLRSFEFVKPLILGMMQVLTLKLKEKKKLENK